MRWFIRLIVVPAVAATSCVIDTVPLPEDDPTHGGEYPFDPDHDFAAPGEHDGVEFGDRIATSAIYFSSSPVLLVGAEGAVDSDGVVVVDNEAREWRGQIASLANGSFAMPILASSGDSIGLRFVVDDQVVSERTLTVEPGSVAAFGASLDMAEGSNGAEPDAGMPGVYADAPNSVGSVTIHGTAGTVSPGITVVIANLDGGGATTAAALMDGSFVAHLAGASGHELAVFGVEPASSNGGGAAFSFSVP
jgi:hypothetical protein